MKTEGNWSRFESEHNKRWHDGAVMYNKSSGRIITPPPEDVVRPAMASGQATAAASSTDLTPEKMGKQDDLLGVASGTGKTTLQPKKPSMGGREDVEMMQREREPREVMNPIGEELEIPEEPVIRRADTMRGPGVNRVDPVIETEQGAGPIEKENIDQGRRWNDFQQKLRSGRSKIIVDCPHCASQDKAA